MSSPTDPGNVGGRMWVGLMDEFDAAMKAHGFTPDQVAMAYTAFVGAITGSMHRQIGIDWTLLVLDAATQAANSLAHRAANPPKLN